MKTLIIVSLVIILLVISFFILSAIKDSIFMSFGGNPYDE